MITISRENDRFVVCYWGSCSEIAKRLFDGGKSHIAGGCGFTKILHDFGFHISEMEIDLFKTEVRFCLKFETIFDDEIWPF